jgi:hypothetical protein
MLAKPAPKQAADPPNHAQRIYDLFASYTKAPKPTCVSVVLVHACMTPAGGWSNETIADHVWLHVKDPSLLEDEIREKASEFYHAARDHADTFDGPQRYSAVCYGKGGDANILRRYDFRLAPSQQAQLLMGETEPATEHGFIAIAARYNEGLTRSTFEKDANLFHIMREEIDGVREENRRLREENAAMRAEAFAHMKATQDMILARHRLELENERAKLDPLRAEAERTGEIWKMAGGVVGKMIENVTGLPLLGSGEAASGGSDELGPIVQILRSIPPERIGEILARLSDDEKARFASAVVTKGNGVA